MMNIPVQYHTALNTQVSDSMTGGHSNIIVEAEPHGKVLLGMVPWRSVDSGGDQTDTMLPTETGGYRITAAPLWTYVNQNVRR